MAPDDDVTLLARLHALERARGHALRTQEAEARAVEHAAAAAGLPGLRARATLVRADILCTEGRRDLALDLLQRAALEAEVADDPELVARVHFVTYVLHMYAGDRSGGRRHALLSVETLPDSAPQWLRAEHLLAVTVALDPGMDSAAAVHEELLDIARSSRDHRLEVFVLNNMAWAAFVEGDLPLALDRVAAMQAVSSTHGLPLRSPDLDTVATVELAGGRPEAALATIRRAMDPQVVGDVQADHAVIVRLTAVDVLRALGRTAEAERELGSARATAVERDLPGLLAQVEGVQAALCADQGRWEEAYRAHVRHTDAVTALRSTQDAFQALLAQAEFDARTARRDRDRYRRLAHTDALTALPNRRAAQRHVEELLSSAAAHRTTLSLLDVDHFKAVNDSFSHEVGDLVLQALAEVLAAACREDPDLFAARLGGEEFVVVHTGDRPRARRVAEDLRRRIASRDWSDLCPGAPVTASIGTVCTSEGPTTFSTLLSSADARLYAAKHAGRNRVVTDEPVPRSAAAQDARRTGSLP